MMNIYNSKLWRENLDTVIQTLPELCELEGKSVLITEATGLICSAIVDLLIRYNETHENKIIVLAAGRSEVKMKDTVFDDARELMVWFPELHPVCCADCRDN